MGPLRTWTPGLDKPDMSDAPVVSGYSVPPHHTNILTIYQCSPSGIQTGLGELFDEPSL